MAFKDLDEFLVVKPIELPIHGKTYSFPGPGDISARAGLLLQRVSSAEGDEDALVLSDAEDEALRSEVFGGIEPELVADGLSFAQIRAAYFTLIACHLYGVEVGEHVWENQGESPAPSRETRRSKTPPTTTRSRGSRGTSKASPKGTARSGRASSNAGIS